MYICKVYNMNFSMHLYQCLPACVLCFLFIFSDVESLNFYISTLLLLMFHAFVHNTDT